MLPAVYSPLKHYGLDKAGMKVGVVGLGGLGHAAVLIGKVPTLLAPPTPPPTLSRMLFSSLDAAAAADA